MRAKLIYEKFTEESDPVEDMGIGIIESTGNVQVLKKLLTSELEELYKRVHNQNSAQVSVDGIMFGALPYYEQIRFNNAVVKALNYKRNIERRDKVRSKKFKPGDAVKCLIKGKWHIGYVQFSKRGLVKTDNYGRIVAKTQRGIMKIPLDQAILLTPKEKREYEKDLKK